MSPKLTYSHYVELLSFKDLNKVQYKKYIYMNYIDRNIKTINQNKTIGIIICKKGNKFITEYASDERIFDTTYELCK